MAPNNVYEADFDFIVAPGETLLETMEELNITQTELSKRTGRSLKTINEIIKGKQPILPETAIQLEKALGVPAKIWNNLEKNYKESLAKVEERKQLEHEVEKLKLFPINQMIKFGWIEKKKDKLLQLDVLLKFFRVSTIDNLEAVWEGKVAFRKSEAYDTNALAMATWIRKAEIEAESIKCQPYKKKTFEEVLKKIRNELVSETNPNKIISELQQRCATAGVAVVFERELKGCRVSGATKWIAPDKALISLSFRHKSHDHLWFTFFHEAAHILLHKKRIMFIEGTKYEGFEAEEQEADIFSSNILIPNDSFEQFLTKGDYSAPHIIEFAEEHNLHPGIIVGRLQHQKIIRYSELNHLKQRYEWAD
ncbi:HigA family addiction module antitoxin (plasmid) [Alkalihalophilus sp. As8PL]|uniref:HigA family addiction module antitoxin n=1 Tax=Alkalihalophilus sp. As8PL TaxID=3237103 RepID=A0AB39BN31_9BACI